MVELLIGKKGTGKTKILIDSVNDAAAVASGNVVFITNNASRSMYDIKSKVRMADASEFGINTWDEILGFICGIISSNFDITNVYVDGVMKIVDGATDGCEEFLKELDEIGKKFGFNTMISVSMDENDAPAYMEQYKK